MLSHHYGIWLMSFSHHLFKLIRIKYIEVSVCISTVSDLRIFSVKLLDTAV